MRRRMSLVSGTPAESPGHDADIMLDLLKDSRNKAKVARKYETVIRKKDTSTIKRVEARSTLVGELLASVFIADEVDSSAQDKRKGGKKKEMKRHRYSVLSRDSCQKIENRNSNSLQITCSFRCLFSARFKPLEN